VVYVVYFLVLTCVVVVLNEVILKNHPKTRGGAGWQITKKMDSRQNDRIQWVTSPAGGINWRTNKPHTIPTTNAPRKKRKKKGKIIKGIQRNTQYIIVGEPKRNILPAQRRSEIKNGGYIS